MQLPMTGSWPVRVKAVRPFTIHGDLYYELRAERTDTSAGELLLRVPQYAAKGEPVAGQLLDVSFLMGQVTAVDIIAEQSP
jgi:hypothetical protein